MISEHGSSKILIPAAPECFAETGQATRHTPTTDNHDNKGNKYKQIFRLRELHLLAFFILVYVGVEVTLGGV